MTCVQNIPCHLRLSPALLLPGNVITGVGVRVLTKTESTWRPFPPSPEPSVCSRPGRSVTAKRRGDKNDPGVLVDLPDSRMFCKEPLVTPASSKGQSLTSHSFSTGFYDRGLWLGAGGRCPGHSSARRGGAPHPGGCRGPCLSPVCTDPT